MHIYVICLFGLLTQGIVNKLGTYALAACAAAAGKPLYVAAESYKFARLYPLHQSDLPNSHPATSRFVDTTAPVSNTLATTTTTVVDPEGRHSSSGSSSSSSHHFEALELDPSIAVVNPSVDFTPAKFITLLFTDLGVLTPSAVSEELIKLYQ